MVKAARIIPDAVRATQARASDPAASAFVSANAGSGKTHVLVPRPTWQSGCSPPSAIG
jgi:ATP-dependent helicase/nuclease subunit A